MSSEHEVPTGSADEPPSMSDAALAYAEDLGWPVFPCGGDDGKKPLTPHGFKDATADPEQIRRWWTAHPNANIGLPCGRAFWVLDVDGDEGERSLADLQGEAVLFTTQVKTGRGRHLYFIGPGPRSAVGIRPGIDVRALGSYVIAPPSLHMASGKRYQWSVEPDQMTEAPSWLIAALGERQAATPNHQRLRSAGEAELSLSETEVRLIQSALLALSHFADHYNSWIEIGMALQWTRAGQQAFDLWHEWSKLSTKYVDETDCWKHWRSFGRREVEVTLGSLFHHAEAAGWDSQCEPSQSDSSQRGLSVELAKQSAPEPVVEPAYTPLLPPQESLELISTAAAIPAKPPFLMPASNAVALVSPIAALWDEMPPAWLYEIPPPRRYLLRTMEGSGAMPLERAGCLSGAGGVSKTYFVIQLAVSVATGRDFLRHFRVDPDAPRRVLLVLGEETADECWRRIYWVCEVLKLDDAEKCAVQQNVVVLPLAGRKAPLLHLVRDTVMETPHLHALRCRLNDDAQQVEHLDGTKTGGWGLVVLDPLARFAGVEAESSNALATQFVQTCEALTEVPGKPTVLIVAHSSKEARRWKTVDSRGVTAITDGFRFAWGLAGNDGNIVELSTMKSNYAKDTGVVSLRRRSNGILESESEAERTERLAASKLAKTDQKKQRREADDQFEDTDLDRRIEQLVKAAAECPGLSKGELAGKVGRARSRSMAAIDAACGRGLLRRYRDGNAQRCYVPGAEVPAHLKPFHDSDAEEFDELGEFEESEESFPNPVPVPGTAGTDGTDLEAGSNSEAIYNEESPIPPGVPEPVPPSGASVPVSSGTGTGTGTDLRGEPEAESKGKPCVSGRAAMDAWLEHFEDGDRRWEH